MTRLAYACPTSVAVVVAARDRLGASPHDCKGVNSPMNHPIGSYLDRFRGESFAADHVDHVLPLILLQQCVLAEESFS